MGDMRKEIDSDIFEGFWAVWASKNNLRLKINNVNGKSNIYKPVSRWLYFHQFFHPGKPLITQFHPRSF